MVVHVDEEILAKSGPELFKELLRVYSVAEVEDYFKAGQWKDDLMRTDIQLMYQHAREAGADDPTPLEDVKMPELPRALLPLGALQPGISRTAPGLLSARPVVTLAPTSLAAKPVAVTAATAAAEVRLTALFVAKWKLDASRTKLMLAKLSPLRRRYVIQQFKAPPGADPTSALQAFITKCETTNAWPALTATAVSALRPVSAGPVRLAATPIVGARTVAARPPSAMTGRPLGAVRPLTVRPGMARPVRPVATPVAGIKRALTPGTVAGMPAAKRPQIIPKAVGARPLHGGARPLRLVTSAVRPQTLAPGGLISGLLQRF